LDILKKEDYNFILKNIEDNFTFRKFGIFICLSTGLRIGEICGLRWDDLDLENEVIKVRRTVQRIYIIENGTRKTELIVDNPKTKTSNREIPMSKVLIKLIKPLKKVVNELFYVVTNEAKPTEPRTYRAYYKEFMKSLDMPPLKFHGLRHSFATRCINAGVDVKTASVMLGHSNITTTLSVYVHPNAEQKKSAIDKMFK
jgi:integrase